MEVNFLSQDKILIFKINEEIDECSVKDMRRKADFEIEKYMPQKVIFDFDRVTFMDSAGIGMIIGRYKQANIVGAKTEVTNLSDGVRKIFNMSGVFKIIPEVVLEERIKEAINL